MILRLHAIADVIEPHQAAFSQPIGLLRSLPVIHLIVRLRLQRIADSCGWTVPTFDYAGNRDVYDTYAAKVGKSGIKKGQLASNMSSIDGLRGLEKPT